MKMRNALIIPDCHFSQKNEESCDYRAYKLMLKVAKKQKIDEIVILGDFADFYGVNAHGKNPSINNELKDEISRVKFELKKLRRMFPKAKIVYIEGNHEFRLARYMANKAPELFGLVDLSTILAFSELKIKYVPYTPDQKYNVLGSKLIARHEHIAGGVHVAHSTVVKAGCSVIFGHCHRIQESQVVMMDGSNLRGIACGWLGNKDHASMQYVKNHHQWSLGFAIVSVLNNGTWFCDLKHIIDYKVIHQGEIING